MSKIGGASKTPPYFLSKNMPLELLYSRNRTNDEVFLIEDVPIESSSIMISVSSFLSSYRRLAGYFHAARLNPISRFETGQGVPLLFGANRVNVSDFPPPFYLFFSPRYGISRFAISVWLGAPDPLIQQYQIPGTFVVISYDQTIGAGRIFVDNLGSSPLPLTGTDIDRAIVDYEGTIMVRNTIGDYYFNQTLSATGFQPLSESLYLERIADPRTHIFRIA